MIQNHKVCPICGSNLSRPIQYAVDYAISIPCEHCGHYAMTRIFFDDFIEYPQVDRSVIASYLYYHRTYDESPKQIPCICTQELTLNVRLRCVTMDEIQNWYPKSFREKIDLFLLNLDARSYFLSDPVLFTRPQLYSAYFVDRNPKGPMGPHPDAVKAQAEYFENYLNEQQYILRSHNGLALLPKGLARVDELQKSHQHNSKNAFIAMSFAPKNEPVRKAIKEALIVCGYDPLIMDEVEHNNQIVPEMLYEIRESRFLVAELSDKNNGAYFEAGYAMGQGKSVIFVCSDEAFASNAHFDVKQANTITWKDPDDLKNRLIARIKATIS